jgi:hypothetical protein
MLLWPKHLPVAGVALKPSGRVCPSTHCTLHRPGITRSDFQGKSSYPGGRRPDVFSSMREQPVLEHALRKCRIASRLRWSRGRSCKQQHLKKQQSQTTKSKGDTQSSMAPSSCPTDTNNQNSVSPLGPEHLDTCCNMSHGSNISPHHLPRNLGHAVREPLLGTCLRCILIPHWSSFKPKSSVKRLNLFLLIRSQLLSLVAGHP